MKTVKRNKWTSLSQWSHWISSQEWIQRFLMSQSHQNMTISRTSYEGPGFRVNWRGRVSSCWCALHWKGLSTYQELVHRDVIDVDSWILCEHRQRDGSTMFWKSPAWASSHYEARTSFKFPDNPWKEGTDFISLNIHFKQKWTHLLLVNVFLVVQSFDLNLFVPESSSTNSLWPSWSV